MSPTETFDQAEGSIEERLKRALAVERDRAKRETRILAGVFLLFAVICAGAIAYAVATTISTSTTVHTFTESPCQRDPTGKPCQDLRESVISHDSRRLACVDILIAGYACPAPKHGAGGRTLGPTASAPTSSGGPTSAGPTTTTPTTSSPPPTSTIAPPPSGGSGNGGGNSPPPGDPGGGGNGGGGGPPSPPPPPPPTPPPDCIVNALGICVPNPLG